MEKLLQTMVESRDILYKAFKEAELTADEGGLAYAEGVLEGVDLMIDLVKLELGYKD